MDKILIIAIIIILVVTTFIFLIFFPKPQCYFDPKDIDETLKVFESEHHHKKIQDEINEKIDEIPFENRPFGKFSLLYDKDTKYNTDLANLLPITYDYLTSMPYVERVMIAEYGKKFEQKKRRGDKNIANECIRCIYSVDIKGSSKGGLWVDGEKRFFKDGEWIIYDDSRENYVFNNSRSVGLILIIDVKRPRKFPDGISKVKNKILFY